MTSANAPENTAEEGQTVSIIEVPEEHLEAVRAFATSLQEAQEPDVEGYIAPLTSMSLGGGIGRGSLGPTISGVVSGTQCQIWENGDIRCADDDKA